MANTPYENFVLENKITSVLNTKLDTKSLMTIDTDLVENAGMFKTVNTYTYTGTVETVAEGNGNAVTGTADFVDTDYTVVTNQQRAVFTDEKVMKDPTLIDTLVLGMAEKMVSKINSDYFAELQKASLEVAYTSGSFSYDAVVDGIAKFGLEDENGFFLIINSDLLASLRKDSDFINSRQGEILYSGQVASVCGLPVIISNLVPSNVAYIASKSAVKMFMKKAIAVASEREENTRTNTIYSRMVNLIALVDATKVVAILPYIAVPVITTAAIAPGANKAFAGTCVAGATIEIVKDGVATGLFANVVGGAWTYTIPVAVAAEVYSVKASATNFYDKASANGITVA
jgi:hypothetical protein